MHRVGGVHVIVVADRRTVIHPVTGGAGRGIKSRSFCWREAAAGTGRRTAGLRVGHGWAWRSVLLGGRSERRWCRWLHW